MAIRMKNVYLILTAALVILTTSCGPRLIAPESESTQSRATEDGSTRQPTPTATLEPEVRSGDEAAPEEVLTAAKIVRRARPSVVKIVTSEGSGSGTIITTEGHILTAAHVVQGYSTVEVLVRDTRTLRGRVVATDTNLDLAIVKISGGTWQYLELGAFRPDVGEEIYILGYPLDLPGEATLTRGLVSAIRRIDGLEFVQTDAALNPGNSGGAALNDKGQLIAVPIIKVADTEGVGFLTALFSINDKIADMRNR